MSRISCKFDARLELDKISTIVARHELAPYGRIQTVIDSEVVRLMDKYTPFKTGMLKGSANMSDFGSGEVENNTPYAKKQYHFGRTPGKDGKRGRFWFERMKADCMDELLDSARKAAKGG